MSDFSGVPGIGAIDHIGIAVADLSAAVALYTDVLGWTVEHTETNTEQGVTEVMLLPPGDSSNPTGPTQVQLLGALSAESPVGRFLAARGPGLHHLAYRVDNLDHVSVGLAESGLRLIYAVPRTGTRGSRINFVHPKDTGGTLIELVEPAAGIERQNR